MKKTLTFFVLIAGIAIGYLLPSPPEIAAAFISFGGDKNEKDYSYLESVTAFRQFQTMVDDISEVVLKDARSEQEVIDGMRFLLRNISVSTEVGADGNPRYPFFQRMDTPARKIGGDNIDGEYDVAVLDGIYDYKISGNIGSVRYLSFTINGGKGMSKRYGMGYINAANLETDAQGNFTLWLSKTKPTQPGTWIQITEDASNVMSRQYIGDRSKETLATYSIEAVGNEQALIDLRSDTTTAKAIAGTTYTFMTLATLHRTVLSDLLDQPNEMKVVTGKTLGGDVAGESNLYFLGFYDLQDDEALIIEVTPPSTNFWNFTTYSIWNEAPEYRYRPTSLTIDSTVLDQQGKARFVLSKDNPGVPNWIDLNRYHRGFMIFRWVDNDSISAPKLQLLKQVDAKAFLDGPSF